MSEEMNAAKATALRKPFPPESIGTLPKGGVDLQFVGHAAVTDRLLTVDPQWTWEPMMYDPATQRPSVAHSTDPEGNLWINLTICGVTRPGVGDGKSAKERIGDAIRNAAMRFGVALDLWAKENLVEFAQAARRGGEPPRDEPPAAPPAKKAAAPKKPDKAVMDMDQPMISATRGHMFALFGELKIPESEQLAGINHIIGRELASRGALTEGEARQVIQVLKSRKSNARQEQEA